MGYFIKRPIVVEAFRIGYDDTPDWFMKSNNARIINLGDSVIEVDTLEGTMTANYGDYIIKGIKGELYPCKADVFMASYDKLEPTRIEG